MESVFSLRVGPKDGAQILRFRYRPLGYPAGFSIFFLFKGLFIYLSAQARMFLLMCKVTFLICLSSDGTKVCSFCPCTNIRDYRLGNTLIQCMVFISF